MRSGVCDFSSGGRILTSGLLGQGGCPKASSHARAYYNVADFNTRNEWLTQKLLKQGYLYHKLRKPFSEFHRQYYDLISKFQAGL